MEGNITIVGGMLGMIDFERYRLTQQPDSPFIKMEACEHFPKTAPPRFFVLDPLQFVPDYRFKLPPADLQVIGLKPGQPHYLLTTLSRHDGWFTTNLLGPVIVNPATLLARQVVVTGSTWSVRHRLFPIPRQEVTA